MLLLSLSVQERWAIPYTVSIFTAPFEAARIYCHLHFQDEGTEMAVQVNDLLNVICSVSHQPAGDGTKIDG